MVKEPWDISYCGLNCAKCDLYLIPENENAAKQVLGWFKQKNWIEKNVDLSQFMAKGRECEGCRGPPEKNWSADCYFRQCASQRSLNYCCECKEFPCEKLLEFANDGVKHHFQTVKNLKLMKKLGLQTFLKQHKDPCFCPNLTKDFE